MLQVLLTSLAIVLLLLNVMCYKMLTLSVAAFVSLLIGCYSARNFHAKPNNEYIFPKQYIFTQQLDHFNPTIDITFGQRYFVSDQYFDKNDGPIFFYTGNEGEITTFINNTGFMWDIAPQFKALVVFAEHRYYGKSMPYGNIQPSIKTKDKFAQLTAEQALADFAELIMYIRSSLATPTSPVIVFGGSYGGMLSAWIRIKYGHIVNGAIAASAPVRYFPGFVDPEGYDRVVTKDFSGVQGGEQCVKNIRNSWQVLHDTAQLPGGAKILSEIFHTCSPVEKESVLRDWIVGTFSNLAMVDYPYENDFLSPLPAWPINVTCSYMTSPDLKGKKLLQALYSAVNVFHNTSGQAECYNISSLDLKGLSTTLWDYQTCTEMVMPTGSNGIDDMFPVQKWDLEKFKKNCLKNYGTVPRTDWIMLNFGGAHLKSTSNIVFSNGELDPWQVGGVLHSVSDSVVSIYIHGAAHHLDLRHSNPKDPPSVVKARQIEVDHIRKWIEEAKKSKVTF